MWWIIGAVVAIAVVLLVKRGRTQNAHHALVIASQNQIRCTLAHFSNSFPPTDYDSRVWQDEYLLGYLNGAISLVVKLVGGPMTTEQKGLVFVDALRGIIPNDWQEVCRRVSNLASANHPEFRRGGEDGMNVVALSMNRLRPEVMVEPDIQAALLDAPQAERLAKQIFGPEEATGGPYAAASGSLMLTYMRRHRIDAGYGE